MVVFTYVVSVCDSDPLVDGIRNVMEYKFCSWRRAKDFAEDAMSRGFYVVMHREEFEKVEGYEM